MELGGDEKKIQALFRELKLEDQVATSGFDNVWNGAQVATPGQRAFRFSFAVVILVMITLSSLLLWSRNWPRLQHSSPGIAGALNRSGPIPTPIESKLIGVVGSVERLDRGKPRWPRAGGSRRHTAMLALRRAEIENALAISSWQSPTATMMQSPADEVLTSLPQLDRSAAELKSFLPHTPE